MSILTTVFCLLCFGALVVMMFVLAREELQRSKDYRKTIKSIEKSLDIIASFVVKQNGKKIW